MTKRKRAEDWNKLYFELTPEDRVILRNMALTRIQQQAKKQERPMVWVTTQSAWPGAPVIIGDQRNPERSQPARGRRESDKGDF